MLDLCLLLCDPICPVEVMAHIEPIFSAIGQGSWVWAQGELNGGNAPAFNFNQGVAVRVSASHFYGTVRAFAVVR